MVEVNGKLQPGTWKMPTMLPGKDQLDEAKAFLAKALRPAGEDGVREALMPAVIALEIPNVPDHLTPEQKLRFVTAKMDEYARLMAHVPVDIIRSACDAHALKGKFFPAISELMEHAGPALEKRQREAWRVDKLIESTARPARPAEPAFKQDPAHVRLLSILKWQEKPGSHLYSVDKAAKTRRELAKLAEDERIAAMNEGRAVEEWATVQYDADLPPAPPEPPQPAPSPNVGGFKSALSAAAGSTDLSPASQAALKRSLAKQHRAAGRTAYADRLDREADALAPSMPEGSAPGQDEPPPPSLGDVR